LFSPFSFNHPISKYFPPNRTLRDVLIHSDSLVQSPVIDELDRTRLSGAAIDHSTVASEEESQLLFSKMKPFKDNYLRSYKLILDRTEAVSDALKNIDALGDLTKLAAALQVVAEIKNEIAEAKNDLISLNSLSAYLTLLVNGPTHSPRLEF
jgi:hypothetical protein